MRLAARSRFMELVSRETAPAGDSFPPGVREPTDIGGKRRFRPIQHFLYVVIHCPELAFDPAAPGDDSDVGSVDTRYQPLVAHRLPYWTAGHRPVAPRS